MAIDVLDYDHGVVNDQADGDGKAAKRHQVQRAAGKIEKKEGADDGKREACGGNDGRSTLAQENEQNQHGAKRPDQDGIADVGDGACDAFSEGIYKGKVERFRDCRAEMRSDSLHVAGELQDVATDW